MLSNDDGEAYDLKIMATQFPYPVDEKFVIFFLLLRCALSNEHYSPEPYYFRGKCVPHQQPRGVRDKLHRCNRACRRDVHGKNNTEIPRKKTTF